MNISYKKILIQEKTVIKISCYTRKLPGRTGNQLLFYVCDVLQNKHEFVCR